jgi:hypothetical protein
MRQKVKCPLCGKKIDALMKDIIAEEHFRVWVDEIGSYQEKSIFYDIYEDPIFCCTECLKPIRSIITVEDAEKFLKGEKI